MDFLIFPTLESAASAIAAIDATWLPSLTEYRGGQEVPRDQMVTTTWAQPVHYVEGWGFPAPADQYLSGVTGYTRVGQVSVLPEPVDT